MVGPSIAPFGMAVFQIMKNRLPWAGDHIGDIGVTRQIGPNAKIISQQRRVFMALEN